MKSSPPVQETSSSRLPFEAGVPLERIEQALRALTFPDLAAVEYDLVFPNLFGALETADMILATVPNRIKLLSVDLGQLMSIYPTEKFAEAARGARSKWVNNPNPFRGHLPDFPIPGAFYESMSAVDESRRRAWFAALSILLISRLRPDAEKTATSLEISCATEIRKCFTINDWNQTRSLFPKVDATFFDQLTALSKSSRLTALRPSQQNFFPLLTRLVDRLPLKPLRARPSKNGWDLEGREPDENNLRFKLKTTYLPDTTLDATVSPDDVPSALIQLDSVARRPGEGEDIERRRLIDSAHRFVRDNQFLPYSWHSLSVEEAWEVARVANALLADPDEKDVGLVGALVLFSGHSPDELEDFVLVAGFNRDEDELPWAVNFLEVTTGLWWHLGPQISGGFRPDLSQRSYLQQHSPWLGLLLPDNIKKVLAELVEEKPRSLKSLLAPHGMSLDVLLERFCFLVRERAPWCRAFPARIRAQAFDWWVARCGDDTSGQLAYGVTEFAPVAPLYYYAESHDDLQQKHFARLKDLGWTSSSASPKTSALFGSWLQPTNTSLLALIRRLDDDIASAHKAYAADQSPKTIAGLHNAVAIYTMVLLIFGTGHRRATEYCFSRLTLNLPFMLAMIADKIVSPANAARPVPLPAICVKQVEAYLKHLRVLFSLVARHDPSLAGQIRTLTLDNPEASCIPFLGLLSEDLAEWIPIEVSFLEKRFADVWPLPLNTPRDMFATDGRGYGLAAEMVHYRMGHIGLGQDPFSEWSVLVPDDVMRQTGRAIDRQLASQGWVVREGLRGRVKTTTFLKLATYNNDGEAYTPRPVLKALAATSSRLRKLVRTAVEEVAGIGYKTHIFTAEEISSMQSSIARSAEGDVHLAAAAINILGRWLSRRDAISRSARAPSVALPSIDPPVFSVKLTVQLHRASELQKACLTHFARNQSVGIEMLRARMAVSLILFGGIVRPELVEPAAMACADAFIEDQRTWIDIRRINADGDVIEFMRRPLDPVTTCLALQLKSRFIKDPGGDADQVKLSSRVNDIFESIALEFNPLYPKGLREACQLMTPFIRYHLPGLIAGVGDGRGRGFSMARQDFIEVVTDSPVSNFPEEDSENLIETGSKPSHQDGASLVLGKQFIKQVNTLLFEALPAVAVGGKTAAGKQLTTADLLVQFDAIPLPERCPAILNLLHNWVRLLIEKPGRGGRRLRIISVYTYWHRIASTLFEFAANFNLAEVEEEVLEELYCDVLDARSPRSRPQRARILRDFHERCGGQLPDMDWYEIEPHIDIASGKVDARIVTPSSFRRATDLLRRHFDKRQDYARALSCALILMYRGGLRIGDVFRLMTHNLKITESAIWIQVKRNRLGGPKTRAGRRFVRLAAPLLRAEEAQLINDWLKFRIELCRNADQTVLCGPSSNPLELYDRRAFEQDLLEILRWATGNPGTKNHHLRHSWLSYHCAAVMPPHKGSALSTQLVEYFSADDPATLVFQHFLNDPRQSRRIMPALSAVIGHASHRSSENYIHLHEFALANFLWRCAPERIDDIDSTVRIHRHAKDSVDPKVTWRGSSYDLSVALSGMSNGELRTQKTRGTDVGNLASLARLMMKRNKLPHGIATGLLPTDNFVPHWTSQEILLEHIHLTLIAMAEGEDIENISRRAGISIHNVRSIAKALQRHGDRCNYRNYFSRTSTKGAQNFPIMPAEKDGHDLYAAFNDVLRKLENITIREGLEVWAERYVVSVPGLSLDTIEDLDAILALTKILGIAADRLTLTRPDTWPSDQWKELAKKIEECGFDRNSIGFHTPSKSIARSDAIWLSILVKHAEGKTRRAVNMKMFHQFCYLAWIAANAHHGMLLR